MEYWLKLDEDLVVNLAQVTHVQWWESSECSLLLTHTTTIAEGTAEEATIQETVDIEDVQTAQLLRAYLSAHVPCMWCWAEENLEQLPRVPEPEKEALQ
jgi:hypothetical protein